MKMFEYIMLRLLLEAKYESLVLGNVDYQPFQAVTNHVVKLQGELQDDLNWKFTHTNNPEK